MQLDSNKSSPKTNAKEAKPKAKTLLYPGAGTDFAPLLMGILNRYSNNPDRKGTVFEDNSKEICQLKLLKDVRTYIFIDLFGHPSKCDIAWFNTVADFQDYLKLHLQCLHFHIKLYEKTQNMIHFTIVNTPEPCEFYYYFGVDFENPSAKILEIFAKSHILYIHGFWPGCNNPTFSEQDEIKIINMFQPSLETIICSEKVIRERLFIDTCKNKLKIYHCYADFDREYIL